MRRAESFSPRLWGRRACIALPLLMLAANLVAWLRWGTDLPYVDDWRAYDERNALSFAVHRLFEPINNTVSPVGLALDALAQRWLGGNPLPYQTLTMLLVLGGLLWLQWRLLGWVFRARWLQAVLFAFTFFMLQAGTYWGEQNLAYHQGLPLLVLLAALLLTLRSGVGRHTRFTATALLGCVAGLSYISGAIAALVMGSCLWLLTTAWRQRVGRCLVARARIGAVALMLSGALTSALQIGLTRSAGTRTQITALTWPDTTEFWVYLLGKIGRSSGKGFPLLVLEVAWTSALAAIMVLAIAWLGIRVCRRRRGSASMRRLALVVLPLAMMVAAYLCLIALGRAGYRDEGVEGPAAIFLFAYERFHFFWVTLLFPWLAAIWASVLRSTGRPAVSRMQVPAMAVALLLACGLGAARDVFRIGDAYRASSAYRATEIRCLMRQLGTDRPFTCPGYELMGLTDLTRAYNHAREIDASFVRYLPIVERDRLGTEWIRWDRPEDRAAVRWFNATPTSGGWFEGRSDPRAVIGLSGESPSPAACLTMGVRLGLKVSQADHIQVFYRPLGVAAYQEMYSVRRPYQPDANGEVALEFAIESATGFEPEVRIDLADATSRWQVTDMRVACRLRMRP